MIEAPKTILVVEDEESLRMAMVYILKSHGYRVLSAASGNEAIEIVVNDKPDLILSDVRMPDGDGIELLKKVRELHSDRPVLFLVTGFTDLKVEEVYDMGADAVFAKPFERKALLQTIKDKLQPPQLQWQHKNPSPVPPTRQLNIKVPSLEPDLNGQVLKIGRGGFFMAFEENPPLEGTPVIFSIDASSPTEKKFEGIGIVRWSRRQQEDARRPGCGIEFKEIHEHCRDEMLQFISEQPTKAFIPKG